MKDVLAVIMAGGKGERLAPLTNDRSKPAVPFGGAYRLIDITLSNAVNSGIYKIMVLPQYKSQSLMDHLEAGWNIFSFDLGHYLKVVPPQMRLGERWYQGTADSVRQNAYLLERDPSLNHVIILSGDHVYKMDYSLFRDYHDEHDADVSISVIEVDRVAARSFGVVEVDPEFNIMGFHEKPQDPVSIPGDPEHALASMGIYIFKKEVLLQALDGMEGMDFGHDIIPSLLGRYRVKAYPYRRFNRVKDFTYITHEDGRRERVFCEATKDSGYWRDVGGLDAYWNSNMDLCGVDPYFNLYGELWPLRTFRRQFPPAKFIFQEERAVPPRVGRALDSLVGQGCIISSLVRNSVLFNNVVVRSYSEVDESVVMDDVVIGRNCIVKKAIIDKQNSLPEGTKIGLNPKEDRHRFTVTNRGITVVPKRFFPPER
ncbi:MAG: glucose-1-phosphate adenylyltransferase [Deltaproteobacteria bacterium]|nr:glucose-1-phosphate adenylyltransferase [Deltaproteobacteria bacterium]